MATFIFVLALYAGLAGAMSYARRDRFTGPAISTDRTFPGIQPATLTTRTALPAQASQQDPVRTAHCVC